MARLLDGKMEKWLSRVIWLYGFRARSEIDINISGFIPKITIAIYAPQMTNEHCGALNGIKRLDMRWQCH